jgi:hypothetical protein
MQNKPNFQKLKTNAIPFATNSYTNISLHRAPKNKPKQTQTNPIAPLAGPQYAIRNTRHDIPFTRYDIPHPTYEISTCRTQVSK